MNRKDVLSPLEERLTQFNHLADWSRRFNDQGFDENESFLRIMPNRENHLQRNCLESSRLTVNTGHKCTNCNVVLFNSYDFLRHRKNCVGSKRISMKSANNVRQCPFKDCTNSFIGDSQMREHLTNIHSVKVNNYVDLAFRTISEFKAWQDKLQDDIGVWYKKISTYSGKEGVKVMKLRCQSGEAREGILKEQLERYCPSAIVLSDKGEDQLKTVRFYPAHYGHYTRNFDQSNSPVSQPVSDPVVSIPPPPPPSLIHPNNSVNQHVNSAVSSQHPTVVQPRTVERMPSPITRPVSSSHSAHDVSNSDCQSPFRLILPKPTFIPYSSSSTLTPTATAINLCVNRNQGPPNVQLDPANNNWRRLPMPAAVRTSSHLGSINLSRPLISVPTTLASPRAPITVPALLPPPPPPYESAISNPNRIPASVPTSLSSQLSNSNMSSSVQLNSINLSINRAPVTPAVPAFNAVNLSTANNSLTISTSSSVHLNGINLSINRTPPVSTSPAFNPVNLNRNISPSITLSLVPSQSTSLNLSAKRNLETVSGSPTNTINCSVLNTVSRDRKANPSYAEVLAKLENSEITLFEAFEWIRTSCLCENYADIHKSNKKANERLREVHLMWCKRQNVNLGSESDTLFDKLSKLGDENPLIVEELLEDDDLENEENYLIAILNSVQIKMLRDLGDCGIVCVDSILSEFGDGKFNMMTVNVIDAVGEPMPCAVCLSDRENCHVARKFFSVIKSKTGVIIPRVFICENEEYVKQWKTVMTEPVNLFLASWQIDAKWQHMISQLNISPNEKLMLYFVLRGLMEILSVPAFETKLAVVVNEVLPKLNLNPDQCFLSKAKLWACCYRHLEVQNCDLKLESLYQEMIAFRSPKDEQGTKKLDALLLATLDLIRQKCLERLTRLESCLAPRLSFLQRRHTESLNCKDVNIECVNGDGNNKWLVKMADDNFCVWRNSDCENCKLSCDRCDVCIHRFMCTCFDNLVVFNLCTHIHLVSKYMKDNAEETVKLEEDGKEEDCLDCEQCRTDRVVAEDIRSEIFRRNAILMAKLQSTFDIETLNVVNASLVTIQKMVDNSS